MGQQSHVGARTWIVFYGCGGIGVRPYPIFDLGTGRLIGDPGDYGAVCRSAFLNCKHRDYHRGSILDCCCFGRFSSFNPAELKGQDKEYCQPHDQHHQRRQQYGIGGHDDLFQLCHEAVKGQLGLAQPIVLRGRISTIRVVAARVLLVLVVTGIRLLLLIAWIGWLLVVRIGLLLRRRTRRAIVLRRIWLVIWLLLRLLPGHGGWALWRSRQGRVTIAAILAARFIAGTAVGAIDYERVAAMRADPCPSQVLCSARRTGSCCLIHI